MKRVKFLKNVSRETAREQPYKELLPRCLWMWGVKEKDMGGLAPWYIKSRFNVTLQQFCYSSL